MIHPFIFLDIDGVLNRHQTHKNRYGGVDADCMEILNNILDSTSAKIIIASAWRYFVLRGEMNIHGFSGMMYTHGLNFGSIIDVLGPDPIDASRGQLIQDWLTNRYGRSHHPRMIAIDDLDLGYTKNSIPFLLTDSKLGLAGISQEKINSVIETLNTKRSWDLSSQRSK